MSKQTKTIGVWLTEFFGLSHTAISENLSAEQYSQFVTEAEAVAGAENAEQAATITELEGKVTSLEEQLDTANQALEDEKKAHSATSVSLADSEKNLTAAKSQNEKLRQAVNPLGDEDLVNKGGDGSANLTQADIEARANFKKNNPAA